MLDYIILALTLLYLWNIVLGVFYAVGLIALYRLLKGD